MDKELIGCLEGDHRALESLMKQALATDETVTRVALFHAIDSELLSHAEAEEAIFYPRLRREPSLRNLALALEGRQMEIKQQLAKLRGADQEAFDWKTALAELCNQVRKQIVEKEQEAFPRMREMLSEEERREMGEAMRDIKGQTRRVGVADRIPHPESATTH